MIYLKFNERKMDKMFQLLKKGRRLKISPQLTSLSSVLNVHVMKIHNYPYYQWYFGLHLLEIADARHKKQWLPLM